MRYTAWIATGPGKLQGCALSDISQSGAKIDVEKSEKLPDRFVLLLSARGKPKRTCRVVWRQPHQIGVEFERQLTEPLPDKFKPRAEMIDADAEPAMTEPEAAEA